MQEILTPSVPSRSVSVQTLIHLVQDVSSIGGIPGRVRGTIAAARGRAIKHVCIAARGSHPLLPEALCAAQDENAVLAFLDTCHATDTVVLTPNNTLRTLPPAVREKLGRLPIIHMASGQLSFIVQDSAVLADLEYVDTYKASRILCLSQMDMSFHRQLGIHEVTKIRLPVATRSDNSYTPQKNRFATYVGRIDFHAKGADRLIPIAGLMKERGLPPLRIFTTDGHNSPDLPAFLALLEEAGLSDWVEITYNETDKPILYGQASVLLLPSKKEAFGNVILEAFSFGVPVIAPSYAPGPAEIIRPGEDGFLLDHFSAEAVVGLLEGLSPERLTGLSQAAFARHHDYSMGQYLTSLEEIAAQTAQDFPGINAVRVFPRLRIAGYNTAQLILARERIRQYESSLSWRCTKPLRWLRARLNRRPQEQNGA
jgi:glycosyltransferase involved in cell wall biosynthesis